MEQMQLKGRTIFFTEKKECAYQVVSGNVLVYIVPYENQKSGRRLLLHEAKEGEQIPALYIESERLGSWCFGLVALDEAVLEEVVPEHMDDIKEQFCRSAEILWFSAEEFEEQMIEQFNINKVKEEGYLYSVTLEQARTKERGFRIIWDMFQKKSDKFQTARSGNEVYDAVAYLCDYMNIPIADYEKIKESCKRKLTVYDIARISRFSFREVNLEHGWHREQGGPLLAYLQENHEPIVCIPNHAGGYFAYRASDETKTVITEAYAQTLEVRAVMCYRPFPMKKMNLKDFIVFGMQAVPKTDFIFMFVLAFLATCISLVIPKIMQILYDYFIPMYEKNGLIQLCMLALACSIGNLSFVMVQNLTVFRSMSVMEYTVQSAVYDRLFHFPVDFFRKYESAELAQRTLGLSSTFKVMANVGMKAVMSAVFSFLSLIQMYTYSKALAVRGFFLVLLVFLIGSVIAYKQLACEEQKMELEGELSSLMFQFLNGIAKIRISGVENRALVEYLRPYAKVQQLNRKKEKMSLGANILLQVSSVLFSVVFYYLIIHQKMDMPVGVFAAFLTAFGTFSGAVLGMVSIFLSVSAVVPAYKRGKVILETLPEYEEDTILCGTITGAIEVNNLSFAYEETSGNVLNNLSFHIKSGEYIGIVGSSGCGKSTLLKLLLGFEKAQQGNIYYDGKGIDSMDKQELRKKFGVVLQEGDLISGSIYDNIVATTANPTMKKVEKVIREVGLEDDIKQMPMGIHTILSENSTTISGGQKQRILIARAIASNPKILFFDEATSALDNVTQKMVCDTLEKLKATKIVIAHRLSTIMNCDRIFVMDAGEIVEQGTYEQLMEQKGRFYQLAVRQMV